MYLNKTKEEKKILSIEIFINVNIINAYIFTKAVCEIREYRTHRIAYQPCMKVQVDWNLKWNFIDFCQMTGHHTCASQKTLGKRKTDKILS